MATSDKINREIKGITMSISNEQMKIHFMFSYEEFQMTYIFSLSHTK